MTTTNTNPTLDLWKAMEDAGIQPYTIGYIGDWKRFRYTGVNGESAWLLKDDALHILTVYAETWLRGRGWFKFANEQGESWSHKKVNRAMALPDAILAEAGRE